MENDEEKNINLIIKNDLTSTSVFKLEYIEQNVNDIFEYQKWKEKMLIELGNNSKQFKCTKDKILFYSAYNDKIKDNYYKCKCPICNNYICYFCSCYSEDSYYFCCIKNNIFKSFFNFGPEAIKEPFDNLHGLYPYLSIFIFFVFILRLLHTEKRTEKPKNRADIQIQHFVYITTPLFMDIFLSIPFTIIYTYFIILIIIISIPFKFVPLKYYLGVVFCFF